MQDNRMVLIMLLSDKDVSHVQQSTLQAMDEVKQYFGLPQSGHVVFSAMYTSKKCFHLTGRLASNYQQLGYLYAGGIVLIGGPHMYFIFKGMEAWFLNMVYFFQVVMFVVYFSKRYILLNKSKVIFISHAPLSKYVGFISRCIDKKILLKCLFFILLVFIPSIGAMCYSFFVEGHYFIFIFLFFSLLWFIFGTMIAGMTLIRIIAKKTPPNE